MKVLLHSLSDILLSTLLRQYKNSIIRNQKFLGDLVISLSVYNTYKYIQTGLLEEIPICLSIVMPDFKLQVDMILQSSLTKSVLLRFT